MVDLLVRGGTVVTAGGSTRADVAVADGRIVEVGPELGERSENAASEIVDANGLLVLPGIVDVHTHIRVATDDEPDRFYRDTVAAAFGGTTTVLAFNNPGTGSSAAAHRSLMTGVREFRVATEHDAAIDYGLSAVLLGSMDDPLAELAAMVEAGVPTAKAFMVYDFRLDDRRLFEALRALGRLGGMLQVHCEEAVLIDAAVEAALQRGDTLPRYHAATRTREAEAVAIHRAMEFARAADAPVHVVHLSSRAGLEQLRQARASGVRAHAETCPQYLALTEDVYDEPDPVRCAGFVISPPPRAERDRDALWEAVAGGSLDVVATDHVPDRLDREKGEAARGVSFERISNGAPGIETLLTVVWSEGVARGRITPERAVALLATGPARLFGLRSKGAIETGRDADLVLFDPTARGTVNAAGLHHTSDYTPYEGLETHGRVRSVFVRGRAVIRDGRHVGERGLGRFVGRRLS